jgi:hypothetical protein
MSKVAWPEGAATAAHLAKRDGVFRICKLNQTTPTRVVKKKKKTETGVRGGTARSPLKSHPSSPGLADPTLGICQAV